VCVCVCVCVIMRFNHQSVDGRLSTVSPKPANQKVAPPPRDEASYLLYGLLKDTVSENKPPPIYLYGWLLQAL